MATLTGGKDVNQNRTGKTSLLQRRPREVPRSSMQKIKRKGFSSEHDWEARGTLAMSGGQIGEE